MLKYTRNDFFLRRIKIPYSAHKKYAGPTPKKIIFLMGKSNDLESHWTAGGKRAFGFSNDWSVLILFTKIVLS
jgi:hypothetical protein